MRIEEAIVQRAWYPFGPDGPGVPEVRRRRVVLNKQERATLRSAAAILERVREAANDLDDGQELDIRDNDVWRACAMGEVGAWELASEGEVITASSHYNLPRRVA